MPNTPDMAAVMKLITTMKRAGTMLTGIVLRVATRPGGRAQATPGRGSAARRARKGCGADPRRAGPEAGVLTDEAGGHASAL